VLVVMRAHATEQEIEAVCAKIQSLGFRAHVMPGAERTAIGITGNHGAVPAAETSAELSSCACARSKGGVKKRRAESAKRSALPLVVANVFFISISPVWARGLRAGQGASIS
jgi:hypothetical protein